MNIAIVIAIDKYGNTLSDLPGCNNDGKIIKAIIKSDPKFEDLLFLNDEGNSANVKSLLTEFIKKHKDSGIEDLFFYFTGHGHYDGNEFFYLFSDYNSKKPRQTSLENSELDNLIRSLKPTTYIKIVDACHSGVTYIKDVETFSSYLKGTKESFNKCYFLFSSQSDQASFQDNDQSDFTKSIGLCIRDHSTSAIRYKDLIDFTADSFKANKSQRPYYIVQADYTELFCKVDKSLQDKIGNLLLLDSFESDTENSEESVESNLLDLIKADASLYCTEEEAITIIGNLPDLLKTYQINTPIADELYEVTIQEITYEDYSRNEEAIGRWFDGTDKKYFVNLLIASDELYERHVYGVIPSIGTPFFALRYIAQPKLQNLTQTAITIIPFVSQKEIILFYSLSNYSKIAWDDWKFEHNAKWSYQEMNLKLLYSQKHIIYDLLDLFWDFTIQPLKERFDPEESKPSDTEEDDLPF